MDNDAIDRLTTQLNNLQIEFNRIQRELLEARQQNEQDHQNQNPNTNQRNPRVARNRPLRVGDRVTIKNKLRLLGTTYPKLSISGEVLRFTPDYVILSVLVPGTVGEYREVRRAPHNLKRVQVVHQ